jgi:hypothetical protein
MERGETRAKGLGTRVGCHSCVDKLLIRDSIKELVLSSSSSRHLDVLRQPWRRNVSAPTGSLNDVGARISSWTLDRLQISRCCYAQVDPNCLLFSPTVIISHHKSTNSCPLLHLGFSVLHHGMHSSTLSSSRCRRSRICGEAAFKSRCLSTAYHQTDPPHRKKT